MKKEFLKENKPILMVLYTFAVYQALSYISKDYIFVNDLVFYILYGIIGFILPVVVVRKDGKRKTKQRSRYANVFLITFSISISIFIQITIALINRYIYNSNLVDGKIFLAAFPVNIAIYGVFSVGMFMYFEKIFHMFEERITSLYAIIITIVSWGILTDEPVKYILIAMTFCFIIFNFKSRRAAFLFVFINIFVTVVFNYIFYLYEPFLIEHYFVFALVIIAFITMEKALRSAERMAFRGEFEKVDLYTPKGKEIKFICIIMLLVGAYLILY